MKKIPLAQLEVDALGLPADTQYALIMHRRDWPLLGGAGALVHYLRRSGQLHLTLLHQGKGEPAQRVTTRIVNFDTGGYYLGKTKNERKKQSTANS